MRRGLSPLGMLGTIIVMLVAAGVFLAILFQGIKPDTVASLQSCDEGVVASVAGPLLGDNSKLKCFSSRFKPQFPKNEEACPDGFEEDGEFCVSDGSGNWQYLLKMGCPEERPYCWSEGKALSANQLINAERQIESGKIDDVCNPETHCCGSNILPQCKGKAIGERVFDESTKQCFTCYVPEDSSSNCAAKSHRLRASLSIEEAKETCLG